MKHISYGQLYQSNDSHEKDAQTHAIETCRRCPHTFNMSNSPGPDKIVEHHIRVQFTLRNCKPSQLFIVAIPLVPMF